MFFDHFKRAIVSIQKQLNLEEMDRLKKEVVIMKKNGQTEGVEFAKQRFRQRKEEDEDSMFNRFLEVTIGDNYREKAKGFALPFSIKEKLAPPLPTVSKTSIKRKPLMGDPYMSREADRKRMADE